MAKKGTVGTSMIPTPEKGVADLGSMPTLDDILKDPGLSMAQKRHKALIFEGYKVPRQRYGSKEEKKTAAKKRRDTAKDTRLAFYKKLGIEPKAKVRLSKEERKEIIGELRKVKSLYPKDFLLSKSMIKWYEHPDHRNSCYWGDKALHFDVSWRRRRCFGNNADCSNCGCLAGAFQSPVGMLRHPRELVRIGFV